YARQTGTNTTADAQLIQAIDEAKRGNKHYGYRRVTAELHQQGFNVNHKHVLRLMHQMACLSTAYNRKTRKYNSYQGQVGKLAPNRLRRRFKTDRPYQKLVADVSEFRYGGRSINE
ncbi:IS3 family transposase, partial [Furfurilactobacillus entadae]|uniref:IS3 family transposase n=1 Tax=Furfurilactobacillus entadae TaxID=2922307 RepID=UPI0038B23B01